MDKGKGAGRYLFAGAVPRAALSPENQKRAARSTAPTDDVLLTGRLPRLLLSLAMTPF